MGKWKSTKRNSQLTRRRVNTKTFKPQRKLQRLQRNQKTKTNLNAECQRSCFSAMQTARKFNKSYKPQISAKCPRRFLNCGKTLTIPPKPSSNQKAKKQKPSM